MSDVKPNLVTTMPDPTDILCTINLNDINAVSRIDNSLNLIVNGETISIPIQSYYTLLDMFFKINEMIDNNTNKSERIAITKFNVYLWSKLKKDMKNG